jgi:hypothetical protein
LARFGQHAVWFAFTSDRFDHSSELPHEANAGNRFYGRDVAELISAGLAKRGLEASFFDEDWGWQTHGEPRPRAVEQRVHEMSIPAGRVRRPYVRLHHRRRKERR